MSNATAGYLLYSSVEAPILACLVLVHHGDWFLGWGSLMRFSEGK